MVNGTSISFASGVFSTDVTVSSGANIFTVVALPNEDECNTLEDEVTLYVDTTNVCTDPTAVLTVDQPTDGLSTTASSVTVAGNVTETTGVLTINGTVVDLDSDGDFSSSVSLSV